LTVNTNTNRTALESFFAPNAVAVIGATERENSVGRRLVLNLLNEVFRGRVYAVNPHHSRVLGLACYSSVAAIPETVDLAILVTPAQTVPALIRECVDAGVRSAIVISAGFKEVGAPGGELERLVQTELRRGEMRLLGPNCLGMMNPRIGLNATFGEHLPKSGSVAFLSQSGALQTAILDWSVLEDAGFSAIVSTGSMLDLGWADLISFFGEDPQTQSILLYMESIGDARGFLSTAREVTLNKPIIVIKAGRFEAAARAATSHTGALAGSDEVFDAAFRRCGVLRVQNISDLFYMAETLGKQPRPRGPKLTILTNAGGPGVLATDALIATGGELAPVSAESMAALDKTLPAHWSHANPIDILGDADPERFDRALEIAVADRASDGLLAILAPQGMTDPARMAEKMTRYSRTPGKPVLASWMGGKAVAQGRSILSRAGIPAFAYPDTAARAFNYMWRYSYNLRGLYETPALCPQPEGVREKVSQILRSAIAAGRLLLTELESKQILALYGIPTVETKVARNEAEAVALAEAIDFPVVLKLHSGTVTHKSDVGGVQLDLQNRESVLAAFRSIRSSVTAKAGADAFLGVTVQPMVRMDGYELIVGSSVDAQFGPIILFGAGGQLVEVYRDRAVALPPLNTTLAKRLMEQTRIFGALRGVRGRRPANVERLEQILVQFSHTVVEQPRIREIEINPLLASPDQILALDARIVLHPKEIPDENLPHSAIRPYPLQYVWRGKLSDGEPILIRPIRSEDEPLVAKFHESLSDQTVYLRYFHMENLSARVAHDRLIRKCFIDYDREIALVAEKKTAKEQSQIMGIGRLTMVNGKKQAELAVLVSDAFQRRGLGIELVRRLICVARDEGVREITANILPENIAMRALANRFGFVARTKEDPGIFTLSL